MGDHFCTRQIFRLVRHALANTCKCEHRIYAACNNLSGHVLPGKLDPPINSRIDVRLLKRFIWINTEFDARFQGRGFLVSSFFRCTTIHSSTVLLSLLQIYITDDMHAKLKHCAVCDIIKPVQLPTASVFESTEPCALQVWVVQQMWPPQTRSSTMPQQKTYRIAGKFGGH